MSRRRHHRCLGWVLMNRAQFDWLIHQWWKLGYERCLADIAAGRPATPADQHHTEHGATSRVRA
jgi:hypothetical protein